MTLGFGPGITSPADNDPQFQGLLNIGKLVGNLLTGGRLTGEIPGVPGTVPNILDASREGLARLPTIPPASPRYDAVTKKQAMIYGGAAVALLLVAILATRKG